jgi:hypothetical protein
LNADVVILSHSAQGVNTMNGISIASIVISIFIVSLSSGMEAFIETFDGTGRYDTNDHAFSGLDTPGWWILGDGTLSDGGYQFINGPFDGERSESDEVVRDFTGSRSFVDRVEIRSPYLRPLGDRIPPGIITPIGSVGVFGLLHFLDYRVGEKHNSIAISLANTDSDEMWSLGMLLPDGLFRRPEHE